VQRTILRYPALISAATGKPRQTGRPPVLRSWTSSRRARGRAAT